MERRKTEGWQKSIVVEGLRENKDWKKW